MPIHSADVGLWMPNLGEGGGTQPAQIDFDTFDFWGENKSDKVAQIACLASE